MEFIAMTKQTPVRRVPVARPQDNAILLAGAQGWAKGTTVSAVKAIPAFYVDGFGAPSTPMSTDVASLRSGEPPV